METGEKKFIIDLYDNRHQITTQQVWLLVLEAEMFEYGFLSLVQLASRCTCHMEANYQQMFKSANRGRKGAVFFNALVFIIFNESFRVG